MIKFVKFAELPVTDQDRAVRFYVEKVGLRVSQDSPYKDGWRWIELEIPDADTRILLVGKPADDQQDEPALILVADDVEQTYKELVDRGVQFTKQPTPAPWNPGEMYALFRDSEGNTVLVGSQ